MQNALSEYTQWFLNPETCPDWINQAVLKERYTRGKLGCPKCSGRLGAFDFVRKREHRELGPIWMQKSRVDLVRHVTIPSVPIHSRKTFPLHTEVTETVKSPSNNEGILTTSGGDASVSVTDSDTSVQRSDPKDSLSATVGTSPQLDLPDSHQTSDVNIEVGQNESNGNILEDVITSGGRFRVLDSLPDNPKEQPLPEKVEDLIDPENAYTCPICLDLLYQAHTCRPCLHVYCAPCLRRLCGATPIHTKCPLCREVIAACLPNHEMTNLVKKVFPKEYKLRNSSEKKQKSKLPPLPSNRNFTVTRINRDRNRNYVLVHWAGVCFVVLLCVMAISILATTVGMLLWYLWETFMDYFIDGLVSINGYFDYSWQLIIMILMEKSDEISPELAKMLLGSFGQVLHAVGKLFNRTIENAKDLSQMGDLGTKKENTQYSYTVSAFQVDLANYVLVMGFVTYLIYRFARYRQARQVEAGQN